jgi:hypothetical protein
MAQFLPAFKRQGYDGGKLAWQTVPIVSGPRYVVLRNGAKFRVSSRDSSICKVTEIRQESLPSRSDGTRLQQDDRVFQLSGYNQGIGYIDADDGSGRVTLSVYTTMPKLLRVAFFFVRDSVPHKTRRFPAEALDWMKQMNGIFIGQADVHLIFETARELEVPLNLGPRIDIKKKTPSEEAHIASWGAFSEVSRKLAEGSQAFKPDVAIYLVWRLEVTDEKGNEVGATIDRHTILVDDTVKNANTAAVMAHEVGHALGLEHEDHEPHCLMFYKNTSTSTTHLTHRDVQKIHAGPS